MNKEILRKNIEQVVMQPCNSDYPKRIVPNGLSEDGKYIMVKVSCDDSSWQCDLVDRDGNKIDYVERILEHLPEKYRDHIVTLKHDNWISYSYVPVFDTDTQAMWDKALSDFYKAKQAWCDKYGCD
jgi:hypothetical protein